MSMDKNKIRAWMLMNDLNAKGVARALGVTETSIYRFMGGTMRSRRILAWFLVRGCPARYLGERSNNRRAA